MDALVSTFIGRPENLEALNFLLDKRVEELKEEMVKAPVEKVLGIQRAIAELRKFKEIKLRILDERKRQDGREKE